VLVDDYAYVTINGTAVAFPCAAPAGPGVVCGFTNVSSRDVTTLLRRGTNSISINVRNAPNNCGTAPFCNPAGLLARLTFTTSSFFGPPHSGWKVHPNCDYGQRCAGQPNERHTGIDSRGTSDLTSKDIYPSTTGIIARIQPNGAPDCRNGGPGRCPDHGLGNTVIVRHKLTDGSFIYTQYSHLASIEAGLREGMCVSAGTKIGEMGSSGKGDPTYWGMTPHLHWEFKTAAQVAPLARVGDPRSPDSYFGYIRPNMPPDQRDPTNWGYLNPNLYLNQKQAVIIAPCASD
jgi:murein DD-endopeptidase MepM/ murein hydrolase activator NlpD